MEKAEIIKRIDLIKDSVKIGRDKVDEILEPHNKIKEHLEAIKDVERNSVVDCEINYSNVLYKSFKCCIEWNEDISNINRSFNDLINDLKASRKEKEEDEIKILEHYINRLRETRYLIDDLIVLDYEKEFYEQFSDVLDFLDDISEEVMKGEYTNGV